jgi:hypothetical protein
VPTQLPCARFSSKDPIVSTERREEKRREEKRREEKRREEKKREEKRREDRLSWEFIIESFRRYAIQQCAEIQISAK